MILLNAASGIKRSLYEDGTAGRKWDPVKTKLKDRALLDIAVLVANFAPSCSDLQELTPGGGRQHVEKRPQACNRLGG